jgi:hypothetical protein
MPQKGVAASVFVIAATAGAPVRISAKISGRIILLARWVRFESRPAVDPSVDAS